MQRRFSGVPEDDAKRLLLSEEQKSLTCRSELADKVSGLINTSVAKLPLQIQLDIQELKSILKHKHEELQIVEQEIEHELATISKPVQLNS